jgi:hypothetical protein
MFEPVEDDNIVLSSTARLLLARTMDENCRILREDFDASSINTLNYMKDMGLNSWETRRLEK